VQSKLFIVKLTLTNAVFFGDKIYFTYTQKIILYKSSCRSFTLLLTYMTCAHFTQMSYKQNTNMGINNYKTKTFLANKDS